MDAAYSFNTISFVFFFNFYLINKFWYYWTLFFFMPFGIFWFTDAEKPKCQHGNRVKKINKTCKLSNAHTCYGSKKYI